MIEQEKKLFQRTGLSGASLICSLNSFPSKTRKLSPGLRMPHLVAMDLAVFTLSPVIILTVMPARWHFLIASGTCKQASMHHGRCHGDRCHLTSGLTGSSMPTRQMQVRPEVISSSSSQFGSPVIVTSFS